jgi:hypothetical protein
MNTRALLMMSLLLRKVILHVNQLMMSLLLHKVILHVNQLLLQVS